MPESHHCIPEAVRERRPYLLRHQFTPAGALVIIFLIALHEFLNSIIIQTVVSAPSFHQRSFAECQDWYEQKTDAVLISPEVHCVSEVPSVPYPSPHPHLINRYSSNHPTEPKIQPPKVSRLDMGYSVRGIPNRQLHHVFLEVNSNELNIRSLFQLSNGRPLNYELGRNITVRVGEYSIVSNAVINSVGTITNNTIMLVTSTVTLDLLPGTALVIVSLEDPSGEWMTYEHAIQVLGVSLYKSRGPGEFPDMLTGRGANVILLKQLEDEALGETVLASAFMGDVVRETPDRSKIQLVIGGDNWNAAELLPWHKDNCKISVSRENLNTRCAMAFSPDYRTFSLRIPPGRELKSSITIYIEWPGVLEYSKTYTDSIIDSSGNFIPTSTSLSSDRLTYLRVDKSLSVESKETGTSGGNKMVIIIACVVVGVLLVVGVLFLYVCMRRMASESNTKSGRAGNSDHISSQGFPSVPTTFGIAPGYVQPLVPIPNPNEGPKHMNPNIFPQPTPVFIAPSAGPAILIPKPPVHPLSMTGQQNNSKLEEKENEERGEKSNEQQKFASYAMWNSIASSRCKDSHDQDKVKSASTRFNLLDMLHGPASRGLVGRNGMPLENPEEEEGG